MQDNSLHNLSQKRMAITEVAISAAVLLLCLFSWINLGNNSPEAAAFPKTIIIIFTVLMLIVAARSIIKIIRLNQHSKANSSPSSDNTEEPWRFFTNIRNVVVILASFVLYALVFEHLGFFSTSFLFLVGLTFLLGYNHYRTMLITYALFLLMIYVVFVLIFDRPIPIGPWFLKG